jgi:hypothetical protein
MTTVTESGAAEDGTTQGGEPLRLPLSPISGDRVRPWSVVGTVVAAGALVLAAQFGYGALLGTVGVLAVAVVAGWPLLGGSHTPTASSVVLSFAGVLILAATATDDGRWVVAAVAFGVIASFFHQLLRPPPRDGLVASLVAAFGVLVVLASGALLVLAGHDTSVVPVLVIGLLASAVGVMGDLLVPVPRIGPFLGFVVLLVGMGAAALAASWSDTVTTVGAVGIGAAVATVSWSLRRVLALEPALLAVRGQLALGAGSVLATGAVLRLFTILT